MDIVLSHKIASVAELAGKPTTNLMFFYSNIFTRAR